MTDALQDKALPAPAGKRRRRSIQFGAVAKFWRSRPGFAGGLITLPCGMCAAL